MISLRKGVAMLAALAFALITSTAQADSFTGSTTDPVDQPPALSGVATPDVVGVAANYDQATGALVVDVAFAAPFPANTGTNISASVGTTLVAASADFSGVCSSGISMSLIGSSVLVSREGSTGVLNGSAVWNADATTVSLNVSNPALAGVATSCGDARTWIRDESGHVVCGSTSCYVSHSYDQDEVNVFKLTNPNAVPAKIRLMLDVTTYSCTNRILVFGETSDDEVSGGQVQFTLTGKGIKRQISRALRDGSTSGFTFRRLKVGKYALTARYLGTKEYAPTTTTKRLRIGTC